MNHPLPQLTKEVIFGATDVYFAGARALFDTFFVFFMNQVLGLPLHEAGLIYSIGLIARAVAEPLFGMISDHFDTRFGKRKPFFVIGAPLVFLTFIALWYPYSLTDQALYSVAMAAAIAYGLVSGAMMSPYAGMAPDIATDYHGRTRLSNIRHLFQLIILSIAIIVFSQYFSENAHELDASYLLIIFAFGLLFSVPFILLSVFIDEPHHDTPKVHWSVLFTRLFYPFKIREYNIYLIMNTMMEIVIILLPALFPFYLKFYLNSFEWLPLYALCLGLGAFLAVFVMMKAGKSWCKIKIFRVSLIVAVAVMVALYLLPPQLDAVAGGLFFLLGMVIAGTSTTRLSMLTDLADVVSKRLHTSCQAIVFAQAKAVAHLVAGGVMMIIFQATDIKNADAVIDGGFIRDLLVYPSIVFLVVGIIASCFYRLNEQKLNAQ